VCRSLPRLNLSSSSSEIFASFLCKKLFNLRGELLLELGIEFTTGLRRKAGVDSLDEAVTANEDGGRPGVQIDRSTLTFLRVIHFISASEVSGYNPYLMLSRQLTYCPTLHGEVVFHVIISFVAQSVDLPAWHDVHAFGILYLSVIAGVMNLKVCELTNVPGTPSVSIFGMWQAIH
jgi:hypothetical protein